MKVPDGALLLDRLPLGVIAIADGRITYANPAAAALVGVQAEALLGTPAQSLLPPEALAPGRSGGVAQSFALRGGTGGPVAVLARVVDLPGWSGDALFTLEPGPPAPPLETGRLYEDSQRQVADLQRLFELGRAVAGELDLPRVLALAARTAASLVGASEVYLFIPVETGDGLVLGASVQAGERTARTLLEERALSLARSALRQRTALAEACSLGVDLACLAATPLYAGDRPLGCLVAARPAGEDNMVNAFDRQELQGLRAVADYAALAVQSAGLFAEQQRRVRELVLLNEVASDCSELGLDRLLPAVTHRICRAIGVDFAALLFFDSAREELVTGAVSTLEGPMRGIRGRPARSTGLCMKALTTRQPRRGGVEALGQPELLALAVERRLSYVAAVPLLVKDRAMGVVMVARAGRALTDDELRLLSAICSEVAVAVENARLFSVTQQRAADLELVVAMGDVIARSLDPRAMLEEAATRLCEVLECDAISIYSREGTIFRSVLERGLPTPLAAAVVRISEEDPVMRLGLETKGPVELLPAVLAEPARSLFQRAGLVRLAVVPLRTAPDAGGAAHAGVLILGRKAPRPFVESELKVLGAVATQLAVGLQNARLFEETRRRMEDLAIVAEAGRALLSAAPIEEVLDIVAERLAQLAKVSDCMILLLDAKARELRRVGASPPLREPGAFVRIGLDETSLAARAVRERRPQSAVDALNDPRVHATNIRLFSSRSVFALPLLAGDQVLGVIMLLDTEERRDLSEHELERTMAVGNQLASAIERARLNTALATSLGELAETQAQLVRRERLAALGELAALVAHEVRNPLGVIFNSLGSLAKLVTLEGDARRVYGIMREEAERIDRIVGDMLDYTRPSEPLLRPACLDQVLREALRSVEASERTRGTPVDKVITTVHVSPELPMVPMDVGLVHQAVVNLLSNAFQSLSHGGHVELGATLVETPAGRRVARIRISDDGPGIAPEVKPRLFEPFFTTKARGSGLGLAVVKRIVDGHRGEIGVVTALGQGTTFLLDLPLESPVLVAVAS